MIGGIIFFIISICIILLIFVLFLKTKDMDKQLLKRLSKYFNLKIIHDREVNGICDNQLIHGYFKKEYSSIFFYLKVQSEDKKYYGIEKLIKRNSSLIIGDKHKFFDSGDIIFDKLAYILVDDHKNILGKFDYKCREYIKYLITENNNFKIENNYIIFSTPYLKKAYWTNVLESMLYISNRLSSTESTEKQLKENIGNPDEIDDVKIKNMECLMDSYSMEKNKDFFKSMLNDPIDRIKICAAYGLGNEGIPYLINILDNEDEDLQCYSLKYLFNLLKDDMIRKLIYGFLESVNEELVVNVIKGFIQKNETKSVKVIIDYINNKKEFIEKSEDIKFYLARYSAKFKVKKNFDWLVSLLNDSKPDIVLSAVNALREINDIKAVEYLIPLTKKILNTEIKKTARDAINILQKNIPDSNRGVLTMMEESLSGELSVDDDEDQGKLTIEKE